MYACMFNIMLHRRHHSKAQNSNHRVPIDLLLFIRFQASDQTFSRSLKILIESIHQHCDTRIKSRGTYLLLRSYVGERIQHIFHKIVMCIRLAK